MNPPTPKLSNSSKDWNLCWHGFTGFFLLGFLGKGIYFLFAQNPRFSLWANMPLATVPWYSLIAMFIAVIFYLVCFISYRYFYARFTASLEHQDTNTQTILPQFNILMLFVGVLLIVSGLLQDGPTAWRFYQEGSIFARKTDLDPEMFYSGQVGVQSALREFRTGFMFYFGAYTLFYRKWVFALFTSTFFLTAAAISDGSRFNFLSSVMVLPFLVYLIHIGKNWNRFSLLLLYVGLLSLPFVAAVLLLLRRGSELELNEELFLGTLTSFDQMDHLINYLYMLPIEYDGKRPLEVFLLLIPRAIYTDKPMIYGMLALQEELYPNSIGNGSGHLVYGHYPLSCVVMACDLFFPLGIIIHGVLTGIFLAFVDSGFRKRSYLSYGVIGFVFFTLWHLVRVGVIDYTVPSLKNLVFPAIFCMILDGRWIKSAKQLTSGVTSK